MTEKLLCSGFGGQGVMSLGQLLAYSGMNDNKKVTWMPSYGPEMRGGTAYCNIIISDDYIASPIITEDCNSVIAMNLPSLEKFEDAVNKGGNLFINSSLVEKKASRDDINAYYINANDIALELGNPKVANVVMLGAYIKITGVLDLDVVKTTIEKVFASKPGVIELNKKALEKGYSLV